MSIPEKVEVLVIGAGPAGSHIARRLAEAGRDVLLIEKRPEIGNPVRCAEAVEAAPLIETVGELEPAWVATPVYGGWGEGPGGATVRYEGDEVNGYVLNRRLFDRGLARRAAEAGARVLTRTQAFGVRRLGDAWSVNIRRGGRLKEVGCRALVAADGVEGMVCRWTGIGRAWPLKELHSCAQARVVGVEKTRTFAGIVNGAVFYDPIMDEVATVRPEGNVAWVSTGPPAATPGAFLWAAAGPTWACL